MSWPDEETAGTLTELAGFQRGDEQANTYLSELGELRKVHERALAQKSPSDPELVKREKAANQELSGALIALADAWERFDNARMAVVFAGGGLPQKTSLEIVHSYFTGFKKKRKLRRIERGAESWGHTTRMLRSLAEEVVSRPATKHGGRKKNREIDLLCVRAVWEAFIMVPATSRDDWQQRLYDTCRLVLPQIGKHALIKHHRHLRREVDETPDSPAPQPR